MAWRLAGWPADARFRAIALSTLASLACGRSGLEPGTLPASMGGATSSVGGSTVSSAGSITTGTSSGGAAPTAGVSGGGTGFGPGGVFFGGSPNGGSAGSPDPGAGGDDGDDGSDVAFECPLGSTCPTQVAIGFYHACAVLSDASATCWGLGEFGALGRGNYTTVGDDELPSSVGPVNVSSAAEVGVKQVTVGAAHSCALLTNGSVKCWGYNNDGELGYGNTSTDIGLFREPSAAGNLVLTDQNNVGAKQVAAGDRHTCALLVDGSVTCWGQGLKGQLGYGTVQNVGDDELPAAAGEVNISSEPGAIVTQLAVGSFHSCALLSDGSVQCWGQNSAGQLGLGHNEDVGDDELPASQPPISLSSSPSKAIQITAGHSHTCALLTDNTVRCWGSWAQLGLGDVGENANIGDDEYPDVTTPIDFSIPETVKVRQISAGRFHTCARFSDGSAKCWGENGNGQLGGASTAELPALTSLSGRGPMSIDFADDVTYRIVAGGFDSCALQAKGTLKCWGWNHVGQLGLGHTAPIGDDELPSSVEPIQLF